METNKATINRGEDKTVLTFWLGEKKLDIILTEDRPNDVKNVFNELIVELKNGEFSFELEDDKEDLFYHISKEYITQLNTELTSIFNELKDYRLLNEEDIDDLL